MRVAVQISSSDTPRISRSRFKCSPKPALVIYLIVSARTESVLGNTRRASQGCQILGCDFEMKRFEQHGSKERCAVHAGVPIMNRHVFLKFVRHLDASSRAPIAMGTPTFPSLDT
jgi:hypothetical protein